MDFNSRWAEIQQHQQRPTTNPVHSDPSYARVYNAPHHPHHPQTYPHYGYFHPSSTNPNPNPNPNPLADSAGPDSGLRPPGVESYAPNPYAPHGGYVLGAASSAQYRHPQQLMQPEAAATPYFDPNAHQQNWGAADPAGYAAMVGANPNPMVWNNQRNRPFTRGINKKKNLKKIKIVQSAWCELCKIDCNSQEILNKHRLGKKHMKNLKKLEEPKNVVANEPVATMEPQQLTIVKEFPSGEGAKGKMRKKRILSSKPEEDIETKRRKLMEGGTAADSVRLCTVCNVVCNSETVFRLHLAGQKHAAKAASAPAIKEPMIGPNPNPNPNPTPNIIPNLVFFNGQASHPTVNGGTLNKRKKKKKSMASQAILPMRCELCMIDCSSQDVLDKHNMGKRHQKNLEKLGLKNSATAAAAAAAAPAPAPPPPPPPAAAAAASSAPAPAPAAAAAASSAPAPAPAAVAAVARPNPEAGMIRMSEEITARRKAKRKKLASISKPGEDLETKKRKLLEGGTTPDSVKVCTVCNVVCNSETVYKYHLAGQKHATLLKKQIEKQAHATATSAVEPQLIPSTTMMATVGPQSPTSLPSTSIVAPHPPTAATAALTIGP